MTDLTPERRAEMRAVVGEDPSPMGSTWWPISGPSVLALLDAADERDRLAAQVERLRARLVPMPDDFDFDRDTHAHLPVAEDADGLTCDICGAELADWAAADEHVDERHTP